MDRGPTVAEHGGCAHTLGMLSPLRSKALWEGGRSTLPLGKELCGWSPGRLGPSAQTPPLQAGLGPPEALQYVERPDPSA